MTNLLQCPLRENPFCFEKDIYIYILFKDKKYTIRLNTILCFIKINK